MSDIKKIKDDFLLKLKENLDLNQVSQIKTELFGKTGLISSQFKQLGKLAEEERKKFASDLNLVKSELENLITKKIKDIETTEEGLNISDLHDDRYIANKLAFKEFFENRLNKDFAMVEENLAKQKYQIKKGFEFT